MFLSLFKWFVVIKAISLSLESIIGTTLTILCQLFCVTRLFAYSILEVLWFSLQWAYQFAAASNFEGLRQQWRARI